MNEVDEGEPPQRVLKRYFEPPADLRVFGLTPASIGIGESFDPDYRRVMLVTIVTEPFEAAEAALLSAHGLSTCPRRLAMERSCIIFSHDDKLYQPRLMVADTGNGIAVACAYTRDEN